MGIILNMLIAIDNFLDYRIKSDMFSMGRCELYSDDKNAQKVCPKNHTSLSGITLNNGKQWANNELESIRQINSTSLNSYLKQEKCHIRFV